MVTRIVTRLHPGSECTHTHRELCCNHKPIYKVNTWLPIGVHLFKRERLHNQALHRPKSRRGTSHLPHTEPSHTEPSHTDIVISLSTSSHISHSAKPTHITLSHLRIEPSVLSHPHGPPHTKGARPRIEPSSHCAIRTEPPALATSFSNTCGKVSIEDSCMQRRP